MFPYSFYLAYTSFDVEDSVGVSRLLLKKGDFLDVFLSDLKIGASVKNSSIYIG